MEVEDTEYPLASTTVTDGRKEPTEVGVQVTSSASAEGQPPGRPAQW